MRASTNIAALAVTFISGALLLGGCEPASEGTTAAEASTAVTTVTGAGSSFAAPIFEHWLAVYGSDHPSLALSYDSVGSGAGIERFLAGSVDIGTTDAPLKPDQAARIDGDLAQLPVTGGMIAIAYNLPGVQGPINLPRDVYPDIFLGQVESSRHLITVCIGNLGTNINLHAAVIRLSGNAAFRLHESMLIGGHEEGIFQDDIRLSKSCNDISFIHFNMFEQIAAFMDLGGIRLFG